MAEDRKPVDKLTPGEQGRQEATKLLMAHVHCGELVLGASISKAGFLESYANPYRQNPHSTAEIDACKKELNSKNVKDPLANLRSGIINYAMAKADKETRAISDPVEQADARSRIKEAAILQMENSLNQVLGFEEKTSGQGMVDEALTAIRRRTTHEAPKLLESNLKCSGNIEGEKPNVNNVTFCAVEVPKTPVAVKPASSPSSAPKR